MSQVKAKRYHDISCGHRVVGHENKCAFLHGHNYRIHFTVMAEKMEKMLFGKPYDPPVEDNGLDEIGRVLDFSVIKERLCMWLEDNWDHKFLHWEEDYLVKRLKKGIDDLADIQPAPEEEDIFFSSLVSVPFNPTAENMAKYLVEVIGPEVLDGTGCVLEKVMIDETRKCSAEFNMGGPSWD